MKRVVLALGLMACSGGGDGSGVCTPPEDGPLAAGTWAAQSGYFIVSHPDGSADVHEPCSFGTVNDARVTGGAVDWTWTVPADDSGGRDSTESLQGTVCGDRLTGTLGSRFGEFTFVKGADADEIACD